MDNIAKHWKNLKKPYVRLETAETIISSAKRLVNLVLQENSLLPKHKKTIMHLAQWFVSEADGKHKTRFRSKLVVDLARDEPTSREAIIHEHVFSRKEVTDQLLDKPDSTGDILDTVLGCIVTKKEHDKLHKIKNNISGWQRYKNAGIVVYDMSPNPPSIHEGC